MAAIKSDREAGGAGCRRVGSWEFKESGMLDLGGSMWRAGLVDWI